jgi:hypothetical protein
MRTHLTSNSFSPLAFVPLAVSITGCAVIGDIFKAGVWAGVFSVVLLAAILVLLVRTLGGSRH